MKKSVPTKPPGQFLFLDFDDVLVTGTRVDQFDDEFGPSFDPGKAEMIGQLQKATDCQIVVISSWKNRAGGGKDAMQRMQAARELPFTIHDTVITNNDDRYQDNKGRGDQIKLWLQEHAATDRHKYCVLDNCEPYFFKAEQLPNFVKVDPKVGLTEQDCAMAKAVLQPKQNYEMYKKFQQTRLQRA